jgi:hypothetical protein
MAVRAKGDHISWVIWTAIANPSYVVWLQIGSAIDPYEGSGGGATFAVSIGARQNIVSNVSAALIDIARSST